MQEGRSNRWFSRPTPSWAGWLLIMTGVAFLSLNLSVGLAPFEIGFQTSEGITIPQARRGVATGVFWLVWGIQVLQRHKWPRATNIAFFLVAAWLVWAVFDNSGGPRTIEFSRAANDGRTIANRITNTARPTLEGRLNQPLTGPETVQILRGNVVLGSATIAADGRGWSFTDPGAPDGVHQYLARIVDLGGHSGASLNSLPLTLTIDTQAPQTPPTPTTYLDNEGPITGTFGPGTTTDDTTPGLNLGTDLLDGTPRLHVDGVPRAASYDPAAGTLTPIDPFPAGTHALAYDLTDAAGNISGVSGSLTLTIEPAP
jgi:hypothetical protein